MSKRLFKLTTEIFIERSKQIHNDYYNYDLVCYKNSSNLVTIKCPKHGEFKQVAKYHMNGSGCKKCSNQIKSEKKRYRWSENEISILKENFPKNSIAYCARLLNLDRDVVKKKIIDLGLGAHIVKRGIQIAWGYKDITSERWYSLLHSAKSRNLEVSIKIEDVWNLYLKQNKKCALSGLPVLYSKDRRKITASVDRIDSKKGYTLDNIQIVHRDINRLKLDFPEDAFVSMCLNVANTFKNKNTKRKITRWDIDILNDTEYPVFFDEAWPVLF
jgi:hypothetical protein